MEDHSYIIKNLCRFSA